MRFPQQNLKMSSLTSKFTYFFLGIIVTSATFTFWRTPSRDWAPYIEDRTMSWAADIQGEAQSGRRSIWDNFDQRNTQIWDEIMRINTCIESIEYRNDLVDYIIWDDIIQETGPIPATLDLPFNNSYLEEK